MNRFGAVIVLALLSVLVNADGNNVASIESVEDINEFIAQNPNITLTPLQRSSGPLQTFHYSFGNHVAGERVVAQENNHFSYPGPRDVKQNFWYPTSGYGAVVTFIDLWIDQTSNVGNAYIVSGGTGQRTITILAEAKYTTFLSYRIQIYGYD